MALSLKNLDANSSAPDFVLLHGLLRTTPTTTHIYNPSMPLSNLCLQRPYLVGRKINGTFFPCKLTRSIDALECSPLSEIMFFQNRIFLDVNFAENFIGGS